MSQEHHALLPIHVAKLRDELPQGANLAADVVLRQGALVHEDHAAVREALLGQTFSSGAMVRRS